METQVRKGYPYLPAKVWWRLREQFKSTLPRGPVDSAYLMSVLGIDEASAKNLMPSLRRLGLIDDASKYTERAVAWRDDEHYESAVAEMFDSSYPDSLRDVAPPPNPDPTAVAAWFSRDTRSGPGNARKLASMYTLLAQGKAALASGSKADAAPRARPTTTPAKVAPASRPATKASAPASKPENAIRESSHGKASPSVHIDVQIHIDPAASAEQIDQIFASMARHLYGED